MPGDSHPRTSADIDVPRDLPYVVVGMSPWNRIWAAFKTRQDAEMFARLLPYGRVCRAVTIEQDLLEWDRERIEKR